MKTQLKLVTAAMLLAFAQFPLTASAQSEKAPVSDGSAAPANTANAASTEKPPVVARTPADWIIYDDTTVTPVLDDVSAHLAAAREALGNKDNAAASAAVTAAARALEVQAGQAAKLDQQRAAADLKLAHQTGLKMAALTKKLDATADQIKAGKIPDTAALDKVLDKAARADLERRWLVTDVTTWYPVAEEPQRHLLAAAEAYINKDYQLAAMQIRKAEAYLRLESERSTGEVKEGLNVVNADLEKTATAIANGTLKKVTDIDMAFSRANHALAVAHRAKAAESWGHKIYDQAGYELKAAAHGLESAAAWSGDQAKAAAAAATAQTRAIGDKLASGGVWARDEVGGGFESLGGALNKLGQTIGSQAKASRFDAGP